MKYNDRFFDANTVRYVTLCAWALTRWPWKFVVGPTSGVTWSWVCSKFDQNRTTSGWVIDNLANFYPHYVIPWPWPLTPWPWTFVVVRASCVQTQCKIWAKSNNPLQSYWRFSTLSAWNFWVVAFIRKDLRGAWTELHQTRRGQRPSSLLTAFVSELGYLAAFPNAGRSKSSYVENDAKFRTFWPL